MTAGAFEFWHGRFFLLWLFLFLLFLLFLFFFVDLVLQALLFLAVDQTDLPAELVDDLHIRHFLQREFLVLAWAENRRADTHDVRPFFDGHLIVMRHAH